MGRALQIISKMPLANYQGRVRNWQPVGQDVGRRGQAVVLVVGVFADARVDSV
jgi:hypothetical protein